MQLYAYIDNDFCVDNMQLSVDFSPINDAQLEIDIGIASTQKTIIGASNTSPIVIQSTAHGLTTGQQVMIARVNGQRAANGGFTVTVVDADHFSLDGSVTSGAYEDGGNWWLCPALCCAVPLTYVGGSTGSYRGTVSGNADLTPGTNYVVLLECKNYRVRRGPIAVTCTEPT